jgi:DNA-directed RNA polymerase specialized sigma24 family protein
MFSTPETGVSFGAGGTFPTTHWSVVLSAGEGGPSPDAQAALERLCRAYWYPLYAYVRRQGRSVEEAQDLTQEFFARLLQKEFLLRGEEGAPAYAGVAAELGLTEGALKVAVHRLRQHYRELLRTEVADTVARPEDVDDELRHLIAVISG